jgi:peptide/nickel transport system ATP-binding protein
MTLVDVDGLTVSYSTRDGVAVALDGASLVVAEAERVGIIGESGSGKTTLAMSIGRLLPANADLSGRVSVGGRDVRSLTGEALRGFRRDDIGYVFQSPMASLDPTKRIDKQLGALAGSDRDLEAILRSVELRDPDRVLRSFPHELSGGMAQRVVIAMALMRSPRLVVADEPTASLDAIVRRRVLDLLFAASETSRAAVLLFTHDLAAVRSFCERVVVMYGGRVVEDGPRDRVLEHPLHPYTRALLRAAPGNEGPDERLEPIPGSPIVLREAGGGCAFAPRCAHATGRCSATRPVARTLCGRLVVCHEAERVVELEADCVA